MCKDNQYGCHATAAAGGIVWTGVVTDLGVTPATEEPVTRTPSTKEGIEAWGIKFLSVCDENAPIFSTLHHRADIFVLSRSHPGLLPQAFLLPARTRATPITREPHRRKARQAIAACLAARLLALWSEALLALRSSLWVPSSCTARRSQALSKNTTHRLPGNTQTSLPMTPCTSQARLARLSLLMARWAQVTSRARWRQLHPTRSTPSRDLKPSKTPLS